MTKTELQRLLVQATKSVATTLVVTTVAKTLQNLDTGDKQIVLFTAKK